MNTRKSKKHEIPSIRSGDIKRQAMHVLTNRWQTLGMVAAQIVFAPELVARREIVSGYSCRSLNARNNLVAKVLGRMAFRGQVHRQKNKDGRWEYRLIPKRSRKA